MMLIKSIMAFDRDRDRSGGPGGSAIYGEAKADTERTEREKQDARVGEVQQELQELGQRFGSLEHDYKTQASDLAKA